MFLFNSALDTAADSEVFSVTLAPENIKFVHLHFWKLSQTLFFIIEKSLFIAECSSLSVFDDVMSSKVVEGKADTLAYCLKSELYSSSRHWQGCPSKYPSSLQTEQAYLVAKFKELLFIYSAILPLISASEFSISSALCALFCGRVQVPSLFFLLSYQPKAGERKVFLYFCFGCFLLLSPVWKSIIYQVFARKILSYQSSNSSSSSRV